VLGTIAFGIVGAAYGLAESVHDYPLSYPLSSWFGVTLYVAIFGALAGFIFSLLQGHRAAGSAAIGPR
jgi:hypothetical protein